MITPGSKYTQLLMQQPSSNNGTTAGGLGHILQQALMGHSMGRDQRLEKESQGRLTQALQQMQGSPGTVINWNQSQRPDGTGDPTTTYGQREPDRQGAITTLLGDPNHAPLAFNLMSQDYTQRQQAEAAANEMVQVPNPNGDGSFIFQRAGAVNAGDLAKLPEGAEKTAAMNDAAALGLQPGTPEYNQYIRDRTLPKPAVTNFNMGSSGIDYGDPEAGLAWARNPDGTVKLDERGAPIALPYQGGSAWNDQQAADAAGETNQQNTAVTAGIMTQDIDRALQIIQENPNTVAGTGSYLDGIRGSAATDLKQLLVGVKANIGFDTISKMRAASPTGGALGGVSEGEHALVQSVQGSLDTSQSPEQLAFNLRRVGWLANAVANGISDGQGGVRRVTQADLDNAAASGLFDPPPAAATQADGTTTPPAPMNPAEREVGKLYVSPNGTVGKWTGQGLEIQ